MGGNMAARYLAAGYAGYGEARNRDAAQWLIDQGLRWVETPREVAQAAEIVMTSLPNDDVVESVASGPDGLLAGLGEGKIRADLSTITPALSRRLSARVRDERPGAQMLDTPVSGSVPQVPSGALTIMVGGNERAYRRAEPVLRVLGTPEYVGESGQGSYSSSRSTSASPCRCSRSPKPAARRAQRDRSSPGRGDHDRKLDRFADAQGPRSAGAGQAR